MKRFLFIFALIFLFSACSGQGAAEVEARAVFGLDRVYVDYSPRALSETDFIGSELTFIGPENGGNVIINIGGDILQASINASRSHPSFEAGYWHHHLYAGLSTAGSPRINFRELLPALGIDDNNADDNTQSAYQRGNLHYIVETGEFRLRFMIDGAVHDLIFTEI